MTQYFSGSHLPRERAVDICVHSLLLSLARVSYVYIEFTTNYYIYLKTIV